MQGLTFLYTFHFTLSHISLRSESDARTVLGSIKGFNFSQRDSSNSSAVRRFNKNEENRKEWMMNRACSKHSLSFSVERVNYNHSNTRIPWPKNSHRTTKQPYLHGSIRICHFEYSVKSKSAHKPKQQSISSASSLSVQRSPLIFGSLKKRPFSILGGLSAQDHICLRCIDVHVWIVQCVNVCVCAYWSLWVDVAL